MRIWHFLLAFLTSILTCACALTPDAQFDERAWLLETTGKVSGADIQHNLGYRGISPQLDLEGSAGLGRNSVTVDWVHIDRSASGQVNGGFSFNGIRVPAQTEFSSHTNSDLVTGFYGYKIGPDILSISPGIGAGYAHYDVNARGLAINLPARNVGVPFSSDSRNSQPFPIGAIQLESIPIGWVDLIARVDGFGVPQGQIIDALGAVRLQYKHLRVESGYRFIRLNAGTSRINIKGAIIGAGLYF